MNLVDYLRAIASPQIEHSIPLFLLLMFGTHNWLVSLLVRRLFNGVIKCTWSQRWPLNSLVCLGKRICLHLCSSCYSLPSACFCPCEPFSCCRFVYFLFAFLCPCQIQICFTSMVIMECSSAETVRHIKTDNKWFTHIIIYSTYINLHFVPNLNQKLPIFYSIF